MIIDSVTLALGAVVPLQISGPTGQAQIVDFAVDTGFNDYMTMPPDVIAALNLPFEAPTLATLADGSVLQLNYYRVTVLWDGQRRSVPVLETNGDMLIGMAIMKGYKLTIETLDGGHVLIEALP